MECSKPAVHGGSPEIDILPAAAGASRLQNQKADLALGRPDSKRKGQRMAIGNARFRGRTPLDATRVGGGHGLNAHMHPFQFCFKEQRRGHSKPMEAFLPLKQLTRVGAYLGAELQQGSAVKPECF